MKLRSVTAAYFSPTGNARRIVTAVAETVSGKTGVPFRTIDFTLPRERRAVHRFEAGDLLVIGTPVYAGRIPNKILPAIQTLFEGNGALAVPVMTFGNRSFDNGLIEMRNELEQHGFHTIAGAAFVSEHVMSDKLAGGRPDAEDFRTVTGVCIKCQACVKICPVQAKYFDDPVMLSHIRMLEEHYARQIENEVFL